MKKYGKKPFYHVRHDLQPKLTEELLLLLGDKSPCSVDKLRATADERGYRLADRSPEQLLSSLGNMHIIDRREHGEISLSHLGKILAHTAKYNAALLPDLIHFTYYILYDENDPSSRFSWAYRLVCEYLWQSRSSVVNAHRLVNLVQEEAQRSFPDYEEYGISFSTNSVAGIINWIEALYPSCIAQEPSGPRIFNRREFCSSELLLLSLEYIRIVNENPTMAQLQLTPEVRRRVACLCLVEEESLDELLQDTAAAFGLILRQTERGTWISLLGDRSPMPMSAWVYSSQN